MPPKLSQPRRTPSGRKPPSPPVPWPGKIVSGGQTGVDCAGLELAIALGIEHGGWCPLGRLAEDGTVPSRYGLTENESTDYTVRTRQNVVDSDATLILYEQRLRGGSLLTRRIAKELGKPLLCTAIADGAVPELAQWLSVTRPAVLNVAGPRTATHRVSKPGL